MVTKLPQNPLTTLEQIIVDADMDSLGREDFLTASLNLKAELEAGGVSMNDEKWYTGQRSFLQQHRYFTAVARQIRNKGKLRNIELLERLIAQAHESET